VHVACMGAKGNAYRILVGKPKGKRLLRRSRRRWEDNIKMELLETWDGLVQTGLKPSQDLNHAPPEYYYLSQLAQCSRSVTVNS
jgi:hypothetical protein